MDSSDIFTFVVFASLLVISPGPNGILITKTVPISGRKAGFANIAGFVAAFYVHGTFSILGISALLVQSSEAFFVLKILGAGYLVWIGIKSLMNALKSGRRKEDTISPSVIKPLSLKDPFFEGFMTNCLNPKVSMFYLAAFPQFISLNSSVYISYLLVSLHSLVNIIWFIFMVILLSKVHSASNNPKFKAWWSSITGIIFVGFGAKLALSRSS